MVRTAPIILNENHIRYFWSKVQKTEEGCWLWTGTKDKDGYGRVPIGDFRRRANRVSWVIHFGEIPFNLQILHHCDNPACVRPDHFWIGTPKQNVEDKVRKGRQAMGMTHGTVQTPGRMPKGEAHPRARFHESEVMDIRKLHAEGARHSEIARKYNCSDGAIKSIVKRRTWKHLP